MSEDSDQEKTEEPTSKRLEDAKKKARLPGRGNSIPLPC